MIPGVVTQSMLGKFNRYKLTHRKGDEEGKTHEYSMRYYQSRVPFVTVLWFFPVDCIV